MNTRRVFVAMAGVCQAVSLIETNVYYLGLNKFAHAAHVSNAFVVELLSLELAAFFALNLMQFIFRRAIPSPLWTVASAGVAFGAMSGLLVHPNRVWLTLAVLASAGVGVTFSSLRTAAQGDHEQRQVQRWTFVPYTLVTAAVAGLTAFNWRVGLGAAMLPLPIVALFIARSPHTPPAATRRRAIHPMGHLLKVRSVMWVIASVALLAAAFQLWISKSQVEFLDLGWTSSAAVGWSWVLTLGRVFSLPLVPRITRLGRGHLDRTLGICSTIMVVAGLLAAATTVGVTGMWPVTVVLVLASFIFEAGMNSQNPMARGYVTGKSYEASTLINLTTTATTWGATQMAVVLSWPGVAWGTLSLAVAAAACGAVAARNRYQKQWPAQLKPLLTKPATTLEIKLAEVEGALYRTEVTVGGTTKPRPVNLGPGDTLVLQTPFHPDGTTQAPGGPPVPKHLHWFTWSKLSFARGEKRPYGARHTRLRAALGLRGRAVLTDPGTPFALAGPPEEAFEKVAGEARWRLKDGVAWRAVMSGNGGVGPTTPLVTTAGEVVAYGRLDFASRPRWQIREWVVNGTITRPPEEVIRREGGKWVVPVAALAERQSEYSVFVTWSDARPLALAAYAPEW